MGQGLFFKIFTWFWLTVILSGVALEATSAWSRRKARVRGAAFERLLPDAAKSAASALEGSGVAGLADYLVRLQQTQSVTAFFFTAGGDEVTRRWTSPAVRKEGLLALREPGLHRGGGNGEIVAQQAPGRSGQLYTMALVLPGNTAGAWPMLPYGRLLTVILMSGVFCFLIARHVARPVLRLQAAAAAIAEGRLETRVGRDLQRREDEIAGLARDFNRMAARIETLVDGQKRLLSDVSHELRSPLARLMVALSLSKRSRPEDVAEHLERIEAEAGRLDKLIGQLLALSRIDSAVDDAQRAPIDLSSLAHEVADDADFEARARGRRVAVTGDAQCSIAGNEDALRSALENIVRNAVRYTAEGTEVEVALRREEGRVGVRVRDHGPGVPDDMLAGIFAPFRRVDESGEGTGLGLTIAERAVAVHGGSIRAWNAEGGGLVVEVELPLSGAPGDK
jgi:two-component system sensor histidine kinase CpxA